MSRISSLQGILEIKQLTVDHVLRPFLKLKICSPSKRSFDTRSEESTISTLKMRRSNNVLKEDTKRISSLHDPGSEEISPEIPNGNSVSASSEIFVEAPPKVMPTLPRVFRSLVNTCIEITNENKKPQSIIELLGNALGVSDYETNMASFWFLDFIALQVLQYETIIDGHGMSVMVSWLAGEMKLIQDKNLSREAFFQEMEEIFTTTSEKLESGYAILHWDLMSVRNSKNDSSIDEFTKQEPKGRQQSTLRVTNRQLSFKLLYRDQKNSNEDRKKFNESSLGKIDESESDVSIKHLPTLKDNADKILDVIMEATYSMYGNSFHYALIVAAFVNPVPLHEYTLPFTIRTPRPIKVFYIENQEKKKTTGKEINKKTDAGKKGKKKKSIDADTTAVPIPPTPVALTDEEILAKKREFILPLMEANEASNILEAYREINNQNRNIAGQKKKIVK